MLGESFIVLDERSVYMLPVDIQCIEERRVKVWLGEGGGSVELLGVH